MWQELKNFYHLAQALAAACYFGFPSKKLTVIGVTGTDGKTTTVNMLYHILTFAGRKVSAISSINATIATKRFDTGFHVTTPSPWQVQKYLKKAQDAKSEYFILEATSHGLDQNRLAFVNFTVGVITNVSREHLDYHKNFDNYLKSKLKLFKNVKYSILNADDESFNSLAQQANGKVLSYSLRENTDFNIKKFPIKLKIPGDFNLENALAAFSAAITLGLASSQVLRALASFPAVSGRVERVNLGQNFEAYVDFAHTPNALEQALKTLKSKVKSPASPAGRQKSKVIAVFGAAGERDKSKRSEMGKIAAKLADIVVLTSEDPRSEKVEDICKEIAEGLISSGKIEGKDFYIIPDRKKAIKFAVDLTQSGDVIGIFGKGHEKSMAIGKKEIPWDEFSVVKKAIYEKL